MKTALLAAGATFAAALAFGVPSASANSDVCAVKAPDGGIARCTAVTADDRVDFASIRTGRDTRAVYRLTCEQGSHQTVDRGRLGRGARRLIATELHNPDCVLRARGFSDTRAVVRVALTD